MLLCFCVFVCVCVCVCPVNSNTTEGRSSQDVHSDLSQRGVLTYMLMLNRHSPVGTYIIPGTAANAMEWSDVDLDLTALGHRASYTHHGLLFDSLVKHWGPPATRPVYKLSLMFVASARVNNQNDWRRLLYDLFGETPESMTAPIAVPLLEAMRP